MIDIRLGHYASVLQDVEADLIFTSPPYNIGSKHPRKDGARRKGKYDSKSYGAITGYPDSLPEPMYQDGQAAFLVWAAAHLREGGVLVYNHKPRRAGRAMIHPASWFLRPEVTRVLTLMEEVIWDRAGTHNHSNKMMWPHTERLYVFRRARDDYSFTNTGDLEFRSDLWRIPLNSRGARAIGHNAPFDVRLAQAVIQAWCPPGGIVCDPYSGSGTTAVAAKDTGRNFVGSEILAPYHLASLDRLEEAAA